MPDPIGRLSLPVDSAPAETGEQTVQLTTRPTNSSSEVWVEGISRERDGAEVRLVLADGSVTSARLRTEELEWLELGVDQIVHLGRPPSARDPGLGLLGECVDLRR